GRIFDASLNTCRCLLRQGAWHEQEGNQDQCQQLPPARMKTIHTNHICLLRESNCPSHRDRSARQGRHVHDCISCCLLVDPTTLSYFVEGHWPHHRTPRNDDWVNCPQSHPRKQGKFRQNQDFS